MFKKVSVIQLFVLIVFTSTISFGQIKNYAGSIVDLFDNPLYGVQITNERTQETVYSNCKGRYQIRSNQSDYLSFVKENYLFHRQRILSGKKMSILLNFDTQLIKQQLNEDRVTLHDFEVPLEVLACPTLFIVDGIPFKPNSSIRDLKPESVYKVNVLKQSLAKDMFSLKGTTIIFIQTSCEYQQALKFPAALEK